MAVEELFLDVGIAAAVVWVGIQSIWAMISLEIAPVSILPGQRTIIGRRNPPSQVVFFSPRKGIMPPSGQPMILAPLSVEYMTIVFSLILSSSSLYSNWPM